MAICFILIASSCNKDENVSSQIANNESVLSHIPNTENTSSKLTNNDNTTSHITNTVTSKTAVNNTSQDNKVVSTIKSIIKTEINNKGELTILYSDGTEENLGKVTNTSNNTTQNNKNIIKTEINNKGELIAVYSDGTIENLGKVTNTSNNTTQSNKNIIKTEINSKGELIVIYSDGTKDNLGKVTDNTTQNNEKISSTDKSSSISSKKVSSKNVSSRFDNETSNNYSSKYISIQDEICTVRGNDLPHKWVSATCENPRMCSFCKKEYGEPAHGHNLNGTGKCTYCLNTVEELILVECPETVTFEGTQHNFRGYSYNTKSREIWFDFTTKSNSELYLRAKFYNNNSLLSTKTIGPHSNSANSVGCSSCWCEFDSSVTKIVLESIS